MPTRSPWNIFRIIYGTSYTFLYIILVILLLVTPGDIIYQSFKSKRIHYIWIIAICYIVTLLAVALVYAMRLYVNKTILAAIPRQYIPIEKGDVHSTVYRLITGGLDVSAAIAYAARPRTQDLDPTDEPSSSRGDSGVHAVDSSSKELAVASSQSREADTAPAKQRKEDDATAVLVTIPLPQPSWGSIDHPDWSSPNSPDLPSVQYSVVIAEFPYLIEAKAITLAPSDPTSQSDPPGPDLDSGILLQRPASMSLRDYVSHLVGLGVIPLTPEVPEFLSHYEHVRFSTRPIPGDRFRETMRLFALILRNMVPFDPAALDSTNSSFVSRDGRSISESDIDNDAPMSHASLYSTAGSDISYRIGPTQAEHRLASSGERSVDWKHRTAPATPRSRLTNPRRRSRSRSSSGGNSFAQSRRPFLMSRTSSSSLASGQI